MTKEQKKGPLSLEPFEKEAFYYILGVPILIASIIFLVGLTHVVLHP